MTFAERFDALPPEARAEVVELMHKALTYRGSALDGYTVLSVLKEIADVFYRNGMEIETYA